MYHEDAIISEALAVIEGMPVRKRRLRPPRAIDTRDWMTAPETALILGCSVATVHRLRRGLISGVPSLPCVPVGTRKFVFRKATVEEWRNSVERGALLQ